MSSNSSKTQMPTKTESNKPLKNIKILDLTNVLAGPFCCHQLVHFGAEVIKVETVGRGDLARQLGADSTLSQRNMGISFLAQNAGKQSVTLNLKHEAGKALFKKLVTGTDVLVENFRPGVMQRLGLDYTVLKRIRPELIYCAISGFGQEGEWNKRPAYDQIIQGIAGVMSITGDEQSAPLRAGYPLTDTIGGLTAAMAISTALNAPRRGGVIDVSMLEATLATMGWVVSNYLIAGVAPSANGNENLTSAPSGTFQTADKLLNIAANKDEQWLILARHLGREDLINHPDFKTREHRKANRYRLKAELETVLTTRPAQQWEEELNKLGIPCGTVLSVPEILKHPQITERGLLGHFTQVPGIERDITVLRTGVKINGKAPAVETPPPQLGQDNYTIYQQLGLTAAEIDDLQARGII